MSPFVMRLSQTISQLRAERGGSFGSILSARQMTRRPSKTTKITHLILFFFWAMWEIQCKHVRDTNKREQLVRMKQATRKRPCFQKQCTASEVTKDPNRNFCNCRTSQCAAEHCCVFVGKWVTAGWLTDIFGERTPRSISFENKMLKTFCIKKKAPPLVQLGASYTLLV